MENTTVKATPQEAALTIFQTLSSDDYSIEEKIGIRRELDTLIRKEIDESITKLQNLRAAI